MPGDGSPAAAPGAPAYEAEAEDTLDALASHLEANWTARPPPPGPWWKGEGG